MKTKSSSCSSNSVNWLFNAYYYFLQCILEHEIESLADRWVAYNVAIAGEAQ